MTHWLFLRAAHASILVVLMVWAPRLVSAQDRYGQTDAPRAPGLINELPRYGGLRKTPEQLAADERFLAEALKKYGSPQAAMQAHVNFGWHYLTTGHAPTAIKRFNQAWLLDSTAADVYYGFSGYLRQQGQSQQADHFMQLGQRHDIDRKGILRYYGSLAIGKEAKRDYAGAIALYTQIVQHDENNLFANTKLGYWYMQRQDTSRASHYLGRAIALNPQDSVSYLNRGWLRYGQKHYAGDVADFTAAIRINPHYISAYANRALAYHDSGNYPAAIADWQSCLQLVPVRDKGQFYRLIGTAKLRNNDKTGACEALAEALRWGDEPTGEKEVRRLIKSTCR
jgi:tetratricopeptide (TPR) repeat protein